MMLNKGTYGVLLCPKSSLARPQTTATALWILRQQPRCCSYSLTKSVEQCDISVSSDVWLLEENKNGRVQCSVCCSPAQYIACDEAPRQSLLVQEGAQVQQTWHGLQGNDGVQGYRVGERRKYVEVMNSLGGLKGVGRGGAGTELVM